MEKDVAYVNIFFGQNHCMGELESMNATNQSIKHQTNNQSMYSEYERDLKRTLPEILVDMASWFGVFLGVSILSIVEIIYWVLLGNQ